jgi:excisionase family DNA binding protein
MAPATLRVPPRLTVAEAAERLGTTPRTIRRWIKSGDLNAEWTGHRIAFVHDDAALRRLERARTEAQAC